MNIAKTTINMNPGLLARLRLFTQRHNRTMTDVIEQGVTQLMDATEQDSLEEMYRQLFTLKGVIKDPILTNASETIDEVLYGDDGVWRGSEK
ncbi:MAG: hypothetical protein KJ064_17760 [Anaerolineae bacterium]|nr:hypothetical protein [Anaerolineae bacterium]